MLEVVPQQIILYPTDVQEFAARASLVPAMWHTLTNGAVNADYSLSPVNPAATVSAYGVHLLKSGTGSVEWMVDANNIPQSGGTFNCNLQDATSTIYTGFEVLKATNQIRIYNQSGTLTTLSHTLVAGDKLKLEVAGTIWRFYLNGIEQATHTPGVAIAFPCFYFAGYTAPMAASSPHIVAPVLVGDWTDVYPAAWAAIGAGSVSPSSGKKTNYTAGSTPGSYGVKASYASEAEQEFTALVVVPPLAIYGPLAVTLQPNATARFKTNYDKAQAKIVTWTAVGGGSFDSSDLYTAPTTQGAYTARASYSTQQQDIAVTVPSVIYFDGALVVQPLYLEAGKQYTLTHNLGAGGTTTWTGTGLGATISASVPYTAPGIVGTRGFVQAVRSGVTVRYEFTTLDKFPFDVNLPHKGTRSKAVLVSISEGQTVAGRVKDLNGVGNDSFELQIQNIDNAELLQIRAFWEEFFPHKRFILVDPIRQINLAVRFDSALSYQANAVSGCNIDISFRVTEK